MRAKICGITNIDDALCAIRNGAWGIGFNFYKKSPRYISVEKAKEIIVNLPKVKTYLIGIFVKEKMDYINDIMEYIGLDFAQIYENIATSHKDKQKCILSINSGDNKDILEDECLKSYPYILLDAKKLDDGKLGGTGRIADWNLAKNLAKKYKLILAGGLNPINVQEAFTFVSPYAVDTASGVELNTRKKSEKLIELFLGGQKK